MYRRALKNEELCYNKKAFCASNIRKMEKVMRKRFLALAIGAVMAMTVVGCSKGISDDVITIKQYEALEVAKVTPLEVTDEDVEMSIQSTLQTKATRTEITDRPVQNGDIVTMDYLGKTDGVAFEGGTAEDAELLIGSGQFIDGFEDALIGHSVGETFDINVTFPENYNEELAGKDAVFTITLHKIHVEVVPELTEELVKELSATATTIEDYKKENREYLELSNEETAKSELEQRVWQALIENCVIEEYPQDMMDAELAVIEEQFSAVASMYGMEIDELLQQVYGVSAETMAQNLIKQELAVMLIAEKEDLVLTLEEYENGLADYAIQYGYDDPAEFEEMVGEDEMRSILLQRRVGDWLIEHCVQI